ncbi:MAG TPA: TolC family protein [Dissulfurispiraceae bacterium]|nr:TolC family protein [Dissulfurispiraceae bacterium]
MDNAASGRERSISHSHLFIALSCLAVSVIFFFAATQVQADDLNLEQLIAEALKNSPDLHASAYRTSAAEYRIPQAKTLPDPMITFGYQNEGFTKFTYGNPDNPNTQGIVAVAQTFPFPGKLALKGEAASKESESMGADFEALRLNVIAKVKELYFDLYDTYKNIDLINERTSLFTQVEDAALARYSAGKGSQQEVLMAQTEKYMLLEKETMLKQKIEALDAMMNTTVGRMADAPLGKPGDLPRTDLIYSLNELITMASEQSPELKSLDKKIDAAKIKVAIAKKDFYPDFTITGSYLPRGNNFDDMWSLTTTINIPIFERTKQRQAVNEAESYLDEARSQKESKRLMLASAIRDNYAMLKASDKLMSLYKDGLIPKSYQDVELSLAGYKTGSVAALTVITRLKSVIDYEISYWSQFAEHEKAVARIEAITGLAAVSIEERSEN